MNIINRTLFYWIKTLQTYIGSQASFLLQEDGFHLLQEDSSRIIIGMESP